MSIALAAPQYVSTVEVDLGAGLGYHCITLQTGPSSTGTMAIAFDNQDGGTFDWFFDVFFDLTLNGNILNTPGSGIPDILPMTSSDNPLDREAPLGGSRA